MKSLNIDEKQVRRYLLGQASPDEETGIEELYFSDSETLELFLVAENELIDAYLLDQLKADERQQFETRFLSVAERRERVELARAFWKHMEGAGKAKPEIARIQLWTERLSELVSAPGFGYRLALSLVVLVAMVAGAWLLINTEKLGGKIEQAQLEDGARPQEQPTQQQMTNQVSDDTQLPRERAGRVSESSGAPTDKESVSRPVIASFTLIAGLTRDVSEENRLFIPAAAEFVRLRLMVESPGKYNGYHASLERVGASKIWQKRFYKSSRALESEALVIRLSASLLVPGDYLLTLTGNNATGHSEIAGDYPFTVMKSDE